MQLYEIRLLKADGKPSSVFATSQASDYAAVRRALRLAAEQDGVEVWRGMECVYSDDRRYPLSAA
jgi:hypothetical protein